MTMVRLHRCLIRHAARAVGKLVGVFLVVVLSASFLLAQRPPVHFQAAGVMPPGAIGGLRLQQGGPLSGYFQPVEIRAPQGARVALAENGGFMPPKPAPLLAAMQIGSVYRLQVTQIPNEPGMELYPTIEVIDRLYPPLGKVWKFPIPIQLTQAELETALRGRFVTRVIYLEDPNQALAHAEDPKSQNWFEAKHGENPLEVADRIGRPVAILRIGGRIPGPEGVNQRFLFGSPPLLQYEAPTEPEQVLPSEIQSQRLPVLRRR